MQCLSSQTKKQLKLQGCEDKYWMRIALLISGEFREFAIAHKFWPFLQWEGLDIYFSVWSTSHIYYPDKHFEVEPVNYRMMNLLKPKALIVEHQPKGELHNNLKMIHRLKQGFDAILNSGIDYDVVITVRPDFFSYSKDEYYREQVKQAYERQICLIDGFRPEASGDSLIIYPIKYVKVFQEYDFTSKFTRLPNGVYNGDIHKIFGEFFTGKAEEMPGMSRTIGIVRVTARELHPLHQKSFRRVDNKAEEWWNKRNGPGYIKRIYDDPDCT